MGRIFFVVQEFIGLGPRSDSCVFISSSAGSSLLRILLRKKSHGGQAADREATAVRRLRAGQTGLRGPTRAARLQGWSPTSHAHAHTHIHIHAVTRLLISRHTPLRARLAAASFFSSSPSAALPLVDEKACGVQALGCYIDASRSDLNFPLFGFGSRH